MTNTLSVLLYTYYMNKNDTENEKVTSLISSSQVIDAYQIRFAYLLGIYTIYTTVIVPKWMGLEF